MTTTQILFIMVGVLIVTTTVMVIRSFKLADRKIEAIYNATLAEAREDALKDLLTSLNVHIGYHTWKQLTDEEKELWADVLDEVAPEPTERWWRA